MAPAGDVDCPCGEKYIRLENGVTKAAKFFFA